MSEHVSAIDPWGIMTGYADTQNHWQTVNLKTRDKLRRAMGVKSINQTGISTNNVLLLRQGQSRRLAGPATLILENGRRQGIERHLPSDLPIGYHTLKMAGGNEVHLIIHPRRCHLPKAAKTWGWALQLYTLHSNRSWGIGDFRDLRRFARWSRKGLAAGFLLLNPLGAPLPVLPMEASPYFPSSRLFLNPLYLCVEEVPGALKAGVDFKKLANAGRALNAERLLNRDKVFRLKQNALEKIYSHFTGHRQFDGYRHQAGETLLLFATFCVLTELLGAGWRQWPVHFRHPASPAVREFAAKHTGRVGFHQWLQWQLDQQFKRAAQELPLMLDVPVGMDASGFDAWLWQDLLALDVAIGAPPDAFNADGQNWGLPPFIPHRLRASGYQSFRQTIRAILRHARGLRIDHVMGLFRLFWIPRGETAQSGAYVRYPADELLAVLAIESQRAGAMVVGEDLGTVERGIRPHLHRQGILSYRLLWFENRPPERYPPQALAAISTHDLFTVAGLWSGKDIEEQQRLGLHPDAAAMSAIRRRLARRVRLKETASSRESILGAHRLLARTPCQLITATLEDALAVEERPNMPGLAAQRPNWCVALPQTLEEIQRDKFLVQLAKILAR